MSTDYMPQSDAGVLAFGSNFNDRAGINPLTYGLTAEQGTAVVDAYSAFQNAYYKVQDPQYKAPPFTLQKNQAKDRFVALAREMVSVIQARPETSDEQRLELRITVKEDGPVPIPRPVLAPVLEVKSVYGRMMNLWLKDALTGKTRKPAGTRSAVMYRYVGEVPPASLEGFTVIGTTTKTRPQVVMPGEVEPGSKVWLSAAWMNPTELPGPACQPVMARTNYDVISNPA